MTLLKMMMMKNVIYEMIIMMRSHGTPNTGVYVMDPQECPERTENMETLSRMPRSN